MQPNSSPSPEIIVGLDIGTSKVCVIVATPDENLPGKLHILGIGKAPSDGLMRGLVTNIDRTVRSIQLAVQEAEQQSGLKIDSVCVGIAGEHIQSFQSRGVITIGRPDNEIRQEDIDRLIADTKRIALPADRRIIHVIPQEYVVDGQDQIYEPVGMSGVRVEAVVHIVTGLITAAQNIYKCVQRARLNVVDLVLEPIASSYAVLEEEEKEVGVALVDIGGGTTDVAVFEEKTIRHTAVMGIAGRKVTDDIRKGLGILTDQAENLKCEHGYAFAPAISNNDTIVLPGIGGRPPMEIDKQMLCKIIQPRMEEILEFVRDEVKRSGYSRHLGAGVVLTGGGSLLKGSVELAREILDMPVRIGIPTGFSGGFVKEIENPMFATGVGLVLYDLKNRRTSGGGAAAPVKEKLRGSKTNIFERMIRWFNDL